MPTERNHSLEQLLANVADILAVAHRHHLRVASAKAAAAGTAELFGATWPWALATGLLLRAVTPLASPLPTGAATLVGAKPTNGLELGAAFLAKIFTVLVSFWRTRMTRPETRAARSTQRLRPARTRALAGSLC